MQSATIEAVPNKYQQANYIVATGRLPCRLEAHHVCTSELVGNQGASAVAISPTEEVLQYMHFLIDDGESCDSSLPTR